MSKKKPKPKAKSKKWTMPKWMEGLKGYVNPACIDVKMTEDVMSDVDVMAALNAVIDPSFINVIEIRARVKMLEEMREEGVFMPESETDAEFSAHARNAIDAVEGAMVKAANDVRSRYA